MMQNYMGITIVFLAILVGMTISFFAILLLMKLRSKAFRKNYEIPDIIGRWECKWFDDAAQDSQPKVEDVVDITKWTRGGEFIAIGHQPQFNLSYPITGEVDPSRVVTLEYRAARYPYETNRGIVCLSLSRDGRLMEGRWFGRRSTGILGGGRVVCQKG
jgi:hypothetical protein